MIYLFCLVPGDTNLKVVNLYASHAEDKMCDILSDTIYDDISH